MPFTLSHVAAVLPLYRPLTRARIFTAAVIGSMVPDFGLLAPESLSRVQTHSLPALLTFSLPVGLAAYWLTLLLIRPAVIEVLPDRASARLSAHPAASIRDSRVWLWAGVAIVLGALTHLVWDGFTHESARGVRMFPLLQDYGPEMAGHAVHMYRWLQYGSSLAGLAALLAAVAMWLWHAPALVVSPRRRLPPIERAAWLCLYALVPIVAMAWQIIYPVAGRPLSLASGYQLELIAVAGMRACVISLLIVSALILLRASPRSA
jgi:uncharacterized membrane protein YhaH (DUF805 family)